MWMPAVVTTSGSPSPFRSATAGPRGASRGGNALATALMPGAPMWSSAVH